ncbi:MAG: copper-translocating P-type ATPase [Aestuariivirga sp.]|uniref:heavy metal translocating P-type ATPase n=1 Tax=Aestuariivirga sp. TaxID=2650926 RepID=UPI0025BFDC79|nr:heavy metal translocating P-type ATPase [Aestuariivirga sp.]MCA3561064.1 copper-translocating P-type ATPase [Aestuariivirga sp.]
MNQIAPARLQSFPVEGMTCASCVRRVETAIAAVPGIESASVNLATERVDVRLAEPATAEAVIAAIKGAGYDVASQTIDLGIEGMTCASCVRRVEKAIDAVPGVVSAAVNLATERATVKLVAGTPFSSIETAIRQAGYEPRRLDALDTNAHQAAKDADYAKLRRDFLIAAVFTLPLFVMEMGAHLIPAVGHWLHGSGRFKLYVVYFLLASIVQFGPGLRFYQKGVPNLLKLTPDMNSLVVLGSTAAWGYSAVATFWPALLPAGTANVYYEASAVIVTLILLGRLLEARAKGRTSAAVAKLVGLQAKSARVARDGAILDVPLDQVVVGDIVQVRPGDRLPVDGIVVAGSSFVDEAMITGEPVPVAKAEGANVTGGTINKTGSFTYRATKVGADTLLAQIIRMVEQAQGAKLPIQALVDRITAWFVPAVMAVAALTFFVWLVCGPEPAFTFGLVNAVAVLIIACPCAMGLATPTSIMVGTGRAAELGVLFRKGEALQSLRDVAVVALDKTGTLTEGRPELTDFEVHGLAPDAALALIAAVESLSEHPIAAAIVSAAKAKGLAIPAVGGFEAVPGFGAHGLVAGRAVAVGADRYMVKLGLDVSSFAASAERLGEQGKTPLYAAIDSKLAAIIAVADPLKPATPPALAALHAMGLKVAMITGDNRRTAEAIAKTLGIDEVIAEVLPNGKVEAVARLKRRGRVAFVGDGINDAPALAAADVGIAIGTGTDIAIESAGVVLMSGDLRGVPTAIGLSQAVIRNIKENLFWAFAYNVLLIPVAAGVLYPVNGTLLSPMIGAGAMALSSVFVVSNALRLRSYRPKQVSP